MLVGISGKIGAGKDTLASYIKQHVDHLNITNGGPRAVQIKKYADALKDIVCILTGCTRMELEDPKYKNSPVPKEWFRTARDAREWLYLQDTRNKMASDARVLDETEVIRIATQLGFKFERTYREMLQELGTNIFREQFHPHTWINATFARYQPLKGHFANWDTGRGNLKEVYPNWIITDVRFPDEAKAIKDRGGILVRIHRLPSQVLSHEIANHPSETSLDKFEGFDEVIDNNGTIEQLREKSHEIVNKFNLR